MNDRPGITEDDPEGIRVWRGSQDPAAIHIVTEDYDAEPFEVVRRPADPPWNEEPDPRLELSCEPRVAIFDDGHAEAWGVEVEITRWAGDEGSSQFVVLSLESAEALAGSLTQSVSRVRSGEAVRFAEDEDARRREWELDDEQGASDDS
jgi:hypothetical protein